MATFVKPSIDKRIAAKMFDSGKLNRMRIREIEKKEKEQKLMAPKRTTLPIIETDFIRTKDLSCNKCKREKNSYGITYEWHLEPVDVLNDVNTKDFYGLNTYGNMKRMFSKITDGIIVQPAKIKIIKYLQANKSGTPMVYVLKSRDQKLDELLLNFILETYDLKLASSTADMDEISFQNHLNSNENLIVFMNDEFQLRNILKCIEYGDLKEIYMMPVSIEYETLHSDGFTKPFFNVLPKAFYQNYGRIKVNFNEPYTCSDLLQWIEKNDITEEYMYDAIEGHLLHDIGFKRPVFATNILSYVLLTYFRTNGGTIEEIVDRIDEIRNASNSIDFAFDGDTIDVAKYAVAKFNNKIIINEKLMIKPVENSATLIELWDYAETLICHFGLQSILILSAEHLKRVEGYVDYNKLMSLAVDYSEILQLEIPLYLPCTNINNQLDCAFNVLSSKNLLRKPVKIFTENEIRAQKIAQYFDDFDEYDESDEENGYDDVNEDYQPENEVTINVEMQKEIDFLKDVTLPMQESYMNVAYCLKRLIGKQVFDGNYFLNLSTNAMIDECMVGNCKYWESVSIKWMKNSLRLFELLGVIQRIMHMDYHYIITEEYDNDEEIQKIARHIEQFSDY